MIGTGGWGAPLVGAGGWGIAMIGKGGWGAAMIGTGGWGAFLIIDGKAGRISLSSSSGDGGLGNAPHTTSVASSRPICNKECICVGMCMCDMMINTVT
jgi:hypothetical protein